jgi:hypothetical protein
MRDALKLGTVLLVLNLGCGDDGSNGPDSSGVDRTKPVASLTEAELRELCELGNELFYTPSLDQSCTTYAALNTSDPASCEQLTVACKESDQGGDSEDAADCSRTDVQAAKTCDALAGDIEDCLLEAGRAYDRLLTETSCDDAGTLDGALAPSAACVDLRSRCPSLFTQ